MKDGQKQARERANPLGRRLLAVWVLGYLAFVLCCFWPPPKAVGVLAIGAALLALLVWFLSWAVADWHTRMQRENLASIWFFVFVAEGVIVELFDVPEQIFLIGRTHIRPSMALGLVLIIARLGYTATVNKKRRRDQNKGPVA